jgi:uncharacterized protein (TIGR00159 family)
MILGNFGIKDIIDILLMAVILYQIYRLVKKTGTTPLFNGILAVLAIWLLVSQIFQLRLLGSVLDKVIDIGWVVIIILFQDEIRRILTSLGSNRSFAKVARFFGQNSQPALPDDNITKITLACMNMARSKTGALIVIQQRQDLKPYEETGEYIHAAIGSRLLENIFFKNSPLHDGAVIIANQRIEAAGCILPVSRKTDLPKHLGLRHRAALGISADTDAIAIVVSEERGKISCAYREHLHANITAEQLRTLLIETLAVNENINLKESTV